MSPLAELVKRYGCSAKLQHAVMRERGWKSPRFGRPGVDDWYCSQVTEWDRHEGDEIRIRAAMAREFGVETFRREA